MFVRQVITLYGTKQKVRVCEVLEPSEKPPQASKKPALRVVRMNSGQGRDQPFSSTLNGGNAWCQNLRILVSGPDVVQYHRVLAIPTHHVSSHFGGAFEKIEQDVWLKVGTVDVLATVAWIADDLCGVTFDRTLDSEEQAHLRHEARHSLVTRLTAEERMAAREWKVGASR